MPLAEYIDGIVELRRPDDGQQAGLQEVVDQVLAGGRHRRFFRCGKTARSHVSSSLTPLRHGMAWAFGQPTDTPRIWDQVRISLATRAVVFRWLSKSLITPTGGWRSGTRWAIYPTSKCWPRQDPNLQPDRYEREDKGRLRLFVASKWPAPESQSACRFSNNRRQGLAISANRFTRSAKMAIERGLVNFAGVADPFHAWN
jgi:hypothetical protein